MSQQHEQNQPDFAQDARVTFSLIVLIAQIMCKMPEALLRWPGSMGSRYLGFQAFCSWLLCYLWVGYYPGEDPRPLLWLWSAATGMMILHRVVGVWRRKRGYRVHSRYMGTPILCSYGVEFLSVFIAGLVLVNWNQAFGSYLIASAVGLWINGAYARAGEEARIRAIQDAQIEQENVMQQMNRY